MEQYEIFVDGGYSQKHQRGFSGFIVVEPYSTNITYSKVSKLFNSTNNRAELIALIMALKYISENKSDKFKLYSDSQYVVKGFNIWMHNWAKKNFRDKKNPDLWREIYDLTKGGLNVSVSWVKGHSKSNDRLSKLNRAIDELVNTQKNIL